MRGSGLIGQRPSLACAMPKRVQLRSSPVALRASSQEEASTSSASAMPVLARQALMTSTAAATLFAAGSANAATEIMDIAAIDNRVALLGTLFVPVLGWVAFNILPGLFRQLETMSEKKNGSIVGPAIGLTAASLLAAQNADAATELADVAAIDNRVALLASLFVPVLGWVAFNILPGLFRQLETMSEKKGSVVGPAVGLGTAASLLAAQKADAASEIAQLAVDQRVLLLGTLFIPVLGWVAFNILPGLIRQLQTMAEKRDD